MTSISTLSNDMLTVTTDPSSGAGPGIGAGETPVDSVLGAVFYIGSTGADLMVQTLGQLEQLAARWPGNVNIVHEAVHVTNDGFSLTHLVVPCRGNFPRTEAVLHALAVKADIVTETWVKNR